MEQRLPAIIRAFGSRHFYRGLMVVLLIAAFACVFQPIKFDVQVDINEVVYRTDEKFLSMALDTSFINSTMKSMSPAQWKKVADIAGKLTPAYLRLGGTSADKLVFDEFPDSYDDLLILTKDDWDVIAKFVETSKLKLLFGLNVLLRNGDDWDSDNAKKLLDYNKQIGLKSDFQLGNEPNSFLHVFNFSVSPEQLSVDFYHLRNMLNSDHYYAPSLLVGPDVTNPKLCNDNESPSLAYLDAFLRDSHHILDAATWHQYYLSGATAHLTDFINFDVMDELRREILAVTKTVRKYSNDLPIWLTETGSAYGGGAPMLSDRFVSTFLLLDKLGLSAKMGIQVIMRQSLVKGRYALLNETFDPNPEFWVAFLYKKIVGTEVLKVIQPRPNKLFRVYAHNVVKNLTCTRNPTLKAKVVVFTLNYSNVRVLLRLNLTKTMVHCGTYMFTAPNDDLQSKSILLNGQLMKNEPRTFANFVHKYASSLDQFTARPYSLNFWIFA